MKILGIDPGHLNLGFAVIEFSPDWMIDPKLLFAQDLNLKKYSNRYEMTFDITNDIIKTYEPNLAIIEKTLVRNSGAVSLLLSQSRGVILLCCEIHKLKYEEVANNRIKKNICARGNATKNDVQKVIQEKFNVNLLQNATDATMIALYGKNYIYWN